MSYSSKKSIDMKITIQKYCHDHNFFSFQISQDYNEPDNNELYHFLPDNHSDYLIDNNTIYLAVNLYHSFLNMCWKYVWEKSIFEKKFIIIIFENISYDTFVNTDLFLAWNHSRKSSINTTTNTADLNNQI